MQSVHGGGWTRIKFGVDSDYQMSSGQSYVSGAGAVEADEQRGTDFISRKRRALCSMAGTQVTKGKRPLRALSASDKIEAIQRVNDGESKASVARQIGVPESTLRGWCKNEDKLRYMSSRHSTPDTDKSSDGIMDGVPEKRAKYDLGYQAAGQYANGVDSLDLSRLKEPQPNDGKSEEVDYAHYTKGALDLAANGLSDVNGDSKEPKPKADSGAKISMSAISPLSTLSHLSGLSGLNQSHLGMSFNEIATNLSLLAQLHPSLNTLANSINPSAKMLRSIRSPKPSHSADKPKAERGGKSHSDSHGEKRSRSGHGSVKDQPVDDAMWYWFKKQQAMMNLASSAVPQLPMSHSHSVGSNRGKEPRNSAPAATPLVGMSPTVPSLDKKSWFYQYYKQFASNLGIHDDMLKSSMKCDNYEQILFSQLTKDKYDPLSRIHTESNDAGAEIKRDETADKKEKPEDVDRKSCDSPNSAERSDSKSQTKVRNVLDNLLLLNNNNEPPVKDASSPAADENEKDSNAENEFACEVSEALEHGEKFLKWLEACQEPSVTRMQVHQLKGLLNNIKANAARRNQDASSRDRISRRK